jgi:hypothetical protein
MVSLSADDQSPSFADVASSPPAAAATGKEKEISIFRTHDNTVALILKILHPSEKVTFFRSCLGRGMNPGSFDVSFIRSSLFR